MKSRLLLLPQAVVGDDEDFMMTECVSGGVHEKAKNLRAALVRQGTTGTEGSLSSVVSGCGCYSSSTTNVGVGGRRTGKKRRNSLRRQLDFDSTKVRAFCRLLDVEKGLQAGSVFIALDAHPEKRSSSGRRYATTQSGGSKWCQVSSFCFDRYDDEGVDDEEEDCTSSSFLLDGTKFSNENNTTGSVVVGGICSSCSVGEYGKT